MQRSAIPMRSAAIVLPTARRASLASVLQLWSHIPPAHLLGSEPPSGIARQLPPPSAPVCVTGPVVHTLVHHAQPLLLEDPKSLSATQHSAKPTRSAAVALPTARHASPASVLQLCSHIPPAHLLGSEPHDGTARQLPPPSAPVCVTGPVVQTLVHPVGHWLLEEPKSLNAAQHSVIPMRSAASALPTAARATPASALQLCPRPMARASSKQRAS